MTRYCLAGLIFFHSFQQRFRVARWVIPAITQTDSYVHIVAGISSHIYNQCKSNRAITSLGLPNTALEIINLSLSSSSSSKNEWSEWHYLDTSSAIAETAAHCQTVAFKCGYFSVMHGFSVISENRTIKHNCQKQYVLWRLWSTFLSQLQTQWVSQRLMRTRVVNFQEI